MLKKWIGDRRFYRQMIAVALPIMIQNGVSTFVNLLDNLMVGQIGTEAMSAVSIVNQFMFVFNLTIFGAVSAAGIFMTQYYGNQDISGEKQTFRYKMLICIFSAILGIGIFLLFSDPLIHLFLTGNGEPDTVAQTANFAHQYLNVMLIGLVPFTIANVYASSMRETGDTVTPMIASTVAVVTNFLLNALLIFGLLGAPKLGVVGAAIATVVSRFLECFILAFRTHRRTDLYPYVRGAFRSLYIPLHLVREITLRGLPLMANELFWSIAVTFANQCYSTCALDVVGAQNIHSTVANTFSVVHLSLGSAIAIILGKMLGAAKTEEAKDTAGKLIAFSVFCGAILGIVMAASAMIFPHFYNTTDSVRDIARFMILANAMVMPLVAFSTAAYFTIRSGGQVMITLLFDSVFMWTILIPICWSLSRFTAIDIYTLFGIGQSTEILKATLGFLLLRRGTWARQLVAEPQKCERT